MEHFELMRDMIHGWTRQHTTDEVIELAGLMRIPAAPVGNGRTLPEMDQFVARGVFQPMPDGAVHPRPPYRLSAAPLRPLGEASALDADRAAVLAELDTAGPGAAREDGGASGDPLPLEGLRVVDLTCFWAGPVATSYLASMGADVVKVESVQRPDGMRFAGAVRNAELWEWSPVFHGANPGKRGITLRLDDEEGIALVRRLIAEADVVVENFSARVLENFGLDWARIHEINPTAILVRMPAFGLDGPWRDRAGFAMTVEQVSGLAWITGYADLPLVIRGFCDPVGGMHAVFALLAALEHRRRTGEGQLVEVPLVEAAINVAAEQVIEFSRNGVLLTRDENRGPVSAPQGVYAATGDDEWVAIAAPDDEAWRRLCDVIGAEDLAARHDLATAAGRRRHHDELDARIERWTSARSARSIVTSLLEAGVPAARLINAHDLHPNAQLAHRGFFQLLEHPRTGRTRYPGWPMRFSTLPRATHRRPPPTLGQHNDEVLRDELGLDDDERARLRGRQVIGERPSFL
jgi:crotonobetainyl-CoA:carnitine CoA-transferase CaiB-like acyl-CoA transferase